MQHVVRLYAGTVLAFLLVAGLPGSAQELFRVTGVSPPGAATLTPEIGEPVQLSTSQFVTPGVVALAADARLMLFDRKGLVAIALGPTTFKATGESDQVLIELGAQARMQFFAAWDDAESAVIIMTQPYAAPTNTMLRVSTGHTCVARDGDTVQFAVVSGDGTRAQVLGQQRDLPSGKLLTVVGSTATVGELDAWIVEQGFEQVTGAQLGVASARESREGVADALFQNIIAWDRHAGAKHVIARLPAFRFTPEIRQTVELAYAVRQVRQPTRALEARTGFGANEVALVSPAAARAQGLRTQEEFPLQALRSNSEAADLLQRTSHQGLGFRGPARLAIPGFAIGTDLRVIGPPGLGAR